MLPSTRFLGSKRGSAFWIIDKIQGFRRGGRFLDLFGGSGSVAYAAKLCGFEVVYNDVLKWCWIVGRALVENSCKRFSLSEVEEVVGRVEPFEGFISRNFPGIFYTAPENKWLDGALKLVKRIRDQYLFSLALASLFQACLVKRPYNMFHRANLRFRLRKIKRSFGNHYAWNKPFSLLWKRFLGEYSDKVFDNRQRNLALCSNAFDFREDGWDVVYMDPPYLPRNGCPTVGYLEAYHFLEGIVIMLLEGEGSWLRLIDFSKKHRPLKLEEPWPRKPAEVRRAFSYLIDKFRETAIIAISYRSDGIPSIAYIREQLRKAGKQVKTFTKSQKYALSNRGTREVLLIGYGT